MLQQTQGIVLRAVKYGETSLVVTVFTSVYGVQAYMVQGVRSSKSTRNKAALLQPASLLDLVTYHHPGTAMQRMREFNSGYIYRHMQEDVVRNSVALFAAELLLRLLPADAPQPDLFGVAWEFFKSLDSTDESLLGNFPLYFLWQCGRELGFEVGGNFSGNTPYLNLQEGGYAAHPQPTPPYTTDADAAALQRLLQAGSFQQMIHEPMSGDTRMRLAEWYAAFLQAHSQHMGNLRSLAVLHSILHA